MTFDDREKWLNELRDELENLKKGNDKWFKIRLSAYGAVGVIIGLVMFKIIDETTYWIALGCVTAFWGFCFLKGRMLMSKLDKIERRLHSGR